MVLPWMEHGDVRHYLESLIARNLSQRDLARKIKQWVWFKSLMSFGHGSHTHFSLAVRISSRS